MQIGYITINGHKAPAIFHADGRIESGPTANRMMQEKEGR